MIVILLHVFLIIIIIILYQGLCWFNLYQLPSLESLPTSPNTSALWNIVSRCWLQNSIVMSPPATMSHPFMFSCVHWYTTKASNASLINYHFIIIKIVTVVSCDENLLSRFWSGSILNFPCFKGPLPQYSVIEFQNEWSYERRRMIILS